MNAWFLGRSGDFTFILDDGVAPSIAVRGVAEAGAAETAATVDWVPQLTLDDFDTAGLELDVLALIRAGAGGGGTADGVASLDGRRRVPDVELGRGVAGGVAALDASGRVPDAQLPPRPEPAQQVPTGTILAFAGVRPSGWLSCRGATVSRATYPALFAVIGTRYGAGDGVTTFNLPDLRGRFPSGASADADVGNTGGEAEHTLTVDEMPAHGHDLGGVRQDGGAGTSRNKLVGTTGTADSVPSNDTYGVRSSGGGQPHNNMPPYIDLNFIIKT